MKKFINDPENLTSELLEGLALSNPDIVSLEDGNLVVNKKLKDADRVTIVTLGGTGHDTGKRHPTIGNNVLISTGAKVLGPFTVGDNSRIGANAVVLQEVPPNSTVVGIKARVVKIDGQRVPSYDLDQIHLPDPLAQELCRLQHRVYVNEQKLKREEIRDREADE